MARQLHNPHPGVPQTNCSTRFADAVNKITYIQTTSNCHKIGNVIELFMDEQFPRDTSNFYSNVAI